MPTFSILTPVFDPPIFALNACAESVFAQSNQDWEWCIVDDASTNVEVTDFLNDLVTRDKRIRLVQRTLNRGIAITSQDCLAMATGDFIALLDHDDVLHPEALEKVSTVLNQNPQIDYLYTDEDKIDHTGRHYDAFLKPDWSPERLRGQNYCCHLSVFRRSIVNQVGGFRSDFEGSQDYDLVLRVTEVTHSVYHLPEVLYHWRSIPGSTATSIDEKPTAFLAAGRALTEHLERVGIKGEVEDAGFGYHRIKRRMTSSPLISVIIPTCGSHAVVGGIDVCLIFNAVHSIISTSTYRNLEIIVVADDHTPQTVVNMLIDQFKNHVKIVPYQGPFNFSDKCNVGFLESRGELIVLFNDDVQVISPDWIETLATLALESDVGLVGPMLLLESGLIQSAGHSNTPSPHNFRNGAYPNQPGDFGILTIARECSGLTGAVAMCRREIYEMVGGLSVSFPNCFNDVDFAYKILDHGFRIVWTPFARLYHFESATRDASVNHKELEHLSGRWGRFFNADRFTRQG